MAGGIDFAGLRAEFPREMTVILDTVEIAVRYSMRTNLGVAAVIGGHGYVMPAELHDMLFDEVLGSSMYILSRPEFGETMRPDDDGWDTSPIDLFARGYLMGMGLAICRDEQPADEFHAAYVAGLGGGGAAEMDWLNELVGERARLFGLAGKEQVGDDALTDEMIEAVAKATEARVGQMFVDSEPEAREKGRAWWQALVDGTVKGAIGILEANISMSSVAQDAMLRRYGSTMGDGVMDDLRIQTTVTVRKEFAKGDGDGQGCGDEG